MNELNGEGPSPEEKRSDDEKAVRIVRSMIHFKGGDTEAACECYECVALQRVCFLAEEAMSHGRD